MYDACVQLVEILRCVVEKLKLILSLQFAHPCMHEDSFSKRLGYCYVSLSWLLQSPSCHECVVSPNVSPRSATPPNACCRTGRLALPGTSTPGARAGPRTTRLGSRTNAPPVCLAPGTICKMSQLAAARVLEPCIVTLHRGCVASRFRCTS